jgi:NAD(P)-dependent dehydrogenase (short-subunit alcohol dehydrogenase family)
MTNRTIGARLEGRRVLLTGVSGGMGKLVAERLAAEGAALAVTDLPGLRFDAVVADLAQTTEVLHAAPADLTDEDQVCALIAGTVEALGGLDVVYNNAGVRFADRDGPVDTIELGAWEATFAVNVTGPFLVCKHAMAHLLGSSDPVVINVSSMAGVGGDVYAHAYGASKGALLALTKGIAQRWGPEGLRAVSICPGLIDTEMLAPVRDDADHDVLTATTALRRLGRPEEVAGVAAFLASSDASFVTSTHIEVHGGLAK